MDIEKNINEYVQGGNKSLGIQPLERYASFDYCFNYFQSFRKLGRIEELANPKYIQYSCLQLGFYLASWGMLRGSAFLLNKSVKIYEKLIQRIVDSDPILWEIDVDNYTSENIQTILDFERNIQKCFENGNWASEILRTKIMLGVYGNVPAFDTNFKSGFGVSTFGKKALEKIYRFYDLNRDIIDKTKIFTIDYATGKPTNNLYTKAKIIDMIFFIEGGSF